MCIFADQIRTIGKNLINSNLHINSLFEFSTPNKVYVLVCVFKIFSKTIGSTEAKFHVEPQWDRGRNFIQMIPVICWSSFEYCKPLGAGAFRRAFTINVAPQCRAFSRGLEIEKLKAPLFRGPEGAGDTNDWCIRSPYNPPSMTCLCA